MGVSSPNHPSKYLLRDIIKNLISEFKHENIYPEPMEIWQNNTTIIVMEYFEYLNWYDKNSIV